jgi:hypothetical protein
MNRRGNRPEDGFEGFTVSRTRASDRLTQITG